MLEGGIYSVSSGRDMIAVVFVSFSHVLYMVFSYAQVFISFFVDLKWLVVSRSVASSKYLCQDFPLSQLFGVLRAKVGPHIPTPAAPAISPGQRTPSSVPL
jgi:hypothetical protein